ncbi:hypothetical protein NEAUS04_1439 [Nematocida ausubeli]|nr:hypothetical protein NEAUS06_0484 [Nematocida ausubeli]KAI5163226.1 hypothetical protein NEAUS04_1439 [Nematocida ausubeli]
MKKLQQKTKTKEDCLEEIEAQNYKTSLEARKTLNSILRTTDKTTNMIYEQREVLEEIRDESYFARDNLEKSANLTVKMKRAGKLLVVGDKVSDKIKSLFKSAPKPKQDYPNSITPSDTAEGRMEEFFPEDKSAVKETTTDVLMSIRNGLKTLHTKLANQNKELKNQVPLIEDITETNAKSSTKAEKVMKSLRKI